MGSLWSLPSIRTTLVTWLNWLAVAGRYKKKSTLYNKTQFPPSAPPCWYRGSARSKLRWHAPHGHRGSLGVCLGPYNAVCTEVMGLDPCWGPLQLCLKWANIAKNCWKLHVGRQCCTMQRTSFPKGLTPNTVCASSYNAWTSVRCNITLWQAAAGRFSGGTSKTHWFWHTSALWTSTHLCIGPHMTS